MKDASSAITALCIFAKDDLSEDPVKLTSTLSEVYRFTNMLVDTCFNAAKASGWWTDLKTGQPLDGPLGLQRDHATNVPAKLMLIVTELAEQFEGFQTASFDDHLPERRTIEVELADTVIRIADTAGALQLRLADAVEYGWTQNFPMGDSFASNQMYVVLEVSRAMEGFRKGKVDEMWPEFTGMEASLARALIRCIGIANIYGLDLAGATREKLEYNAQRPDHKLANRAAEGGKSV